MDPNPGKEIEVDPDSGQGRRSKWIRPNIMDPVGSESDPLHKAAKKVICPFKQRQKKDFKIYENNEDVKTRSDRHSQANCHTLIQTCSQTHGSADKVIFRGNFTPKSNYEANH